MGSTLSTEICEREYGIKLNCSTDIDVDGKVTRVGEFAYGEFEGDVDIAGIGSHTREREYQRSPISITGFFEVLILTCSDQQIFTGSAYAITLKYVKGCSISAYHYNIICNMLLITCATHLMAVTISHNYWEHPYLGLLRVGVTALVFVVTGIFLSNDNKEFPNGPPAADAQYSDMLKMSACFQTGKINLDEQTKATFDLSADAPFRNAIPGLMQYLSSCSSSTPSPCLMGEFNDENNATSFGQLVPILLMSLTVFTFCQVLAERWDIKRAKKRAVRLDREAQEAELNTNGITIVRREAGGDYFDDITPGADKKPGFDVAVKPASMDADSDAITPDGRGPVSRTLSTPRIPQQDSGVTPRVSGQEIGGAQVGKKDEKVEKKN
ncbi:hypothetical protein B0T25DRAFT_520288 [Lasiosphaeria hispida]|uniref:Uncharacterized protein n=1 Tax=Lasiosphaeria hispida TaxID=260671 RepID=A0AAJ0MD43_9PEZI|nr:hypothetical protein B0T25DRAFT_520288 [Lasiosphaeria hispida]